MIKYALTCAVNQQIHTDKYALIYIINHIPVFACWVLMNLTL